MFGYANIFLQNVTFFKISAFIITQKEIEFLADLMCGQVCILHTMNLADLHHSFALSEFEAQCALLIMEYFKWHVCPLGMVHTNLQDISCHCMLRIVKWLHNLICSVPVRLTAKCQLKSYKISAPDLYIVFYSNENKLTKRFYPKHRIVGS